MRLAKTRAARKAKRDVMVAALDKRATPAQVREKLLKTKAVAAKKAAVRFVHFSNYRPFLRCAKIDSLLGEGKKGSREGGSCEDESREGKGSETFSVGKGSVGKGTIVVSKGSVRVGGGTVSIGPGSNCVGVGSVSVAGRIYTISVGKISRSCVSKVCDDSVR